MYILRQDNTIHFTGENAENKEERGKERKRKKNNNTPSLVKRDNY
jgi:hypothetical protein